VGKGLARIRVQVSAAHSRPQLERAVEAFARVGHELGILAGTASGN
jgi:glycine C-acetyltransferase